MTEYDYKKACEWLGEGNNPHSIGGRATDIGAIGDSFNQAVKNRFSINEVPEEIAYQ
ncbi:MAG: hypothetical protein ACYTF1_25155 [Planctomycetota bacterium]|jgi:hypothetical protein